MVKAGKWYVVAGSQPKRSFEQVQTHSAASVSQPRRTWAPPSTRVQEMAAEHRRAGAGPF